MLKPVTTTLYEDRFDRADTPPGPSALGEDWTLRGRRQLWNVPTFYMEDPWPPELHEDEEWYPSVSSSRARITLPGREGYPLLFWGDLYRAAAFVENTKIALSDAATYTLQVTAPLGAPGDRSWGTYARTRVGLWASTEHPELPPVTAYGAGFLEWSAVTGPETQFVWRDTSVSPDDDIEMIVIHPGAPYLGTVYVGFYVECCVWFSMPYTSPWNFWQWVTDSAAFADWFRVTKTVPHPKRRAHPVHRVIDYHSGLRFPATTHEPDTSETPVSENDCGALIVAGNEPVTVVDADTLIIGQVSSPQPPASWNAWWKRLYYDNPWPAQRPRSLWKAQALEY